MIRSMCNFHTKVNEYTKKVKFLKEAKRKIKQIKINEPMKDQTNKPMK